MIVVCPLIIICVLGKKEVDISIWGIGLSHLCGNRSGQLLLPCCNRVWQVLVALYPSHRPDSQGLQTKRQVEGATTPYSTRGPRLGFLPLQDTHTPEEQEQPGQAPHILSRPCPRCYVCLRARLGVACFRTVRRAAKSPPSSVPYQERSIRPLLPEKQTRVGT